MVSYILLSIIAILVAFVNKQKMKISLKLKYVGTPLGGVFTLAA